VLLTFAPSAARHGISQERAAYVVEHCPAPYYAPPRAGMDDRILYLGPDRNGVPLEVGAVERSNGELFVIHAMPLRRSFEDDYAAVMRWHER